MKKHLAGASLALLMGGVAVLLTPYLSFLDSSSLALLTGLVLSAYLKGKSELVPGLTWVGKKGLQFSIILLGLRLSFTDIKGVGLWSYQLSLPFLLLTLALAYLLGRWLKLPRALSLLVGFGTAICGGSAIAAASPILEADEEDIGLALSTIFLYNLLALFLFPSLGQVLGLSERTFGLWAGLAINDTSSVVAAGYSYGQGAGDVATVVKLARTLLIVPACLGFGLGRLGQGQSSQLSRFKGIFPTFVLWFLLATLLTSLGLVPAAWVELSKPLSKWLMAAALFGIGSKLSLRQIKTAGLKPLFLGGLVWLTLSILSLLVLKLTSA